jgi:hypothetical protein
MGTPGHGQDLPPLAFQEERHGQDQQKDENGGQGAQGNESGCAAKNLCCPVEKKLPTESLGIPSADGGAMHAI